MRVSAMYLLTFKEVCLKEIKENILTACNLKQRFQNSIGEEISPLLILYLNDHHKVEMVKVTRPLRLHRAENSTHIVITNQVIASLTK